MEGWRGEVEASQSTPHWSVLLHKRHCRWRDEEGCSCLLQPQVAREREGENEGGGERGERGERGEGEGGIERGWRE